MRHASTGRSRGPALLVDAAIAREMRSYHVPFVAPKRCAPAPRMQARRRADPRHPVRALARSSRPSSPSSSQERPPARSAAIAAHITRLGLASSFRERGFPGCCSVSIDNEVINVPPSSRRLEAGTVLKLQIGIKGNTTYATQGWTYSIGDRDDEVTRLMTAGIEALRLAVAGATRGARVGTISAAIQGRIEADARRSSWASSWLTRVGSGGAGAMLRRGDAPLQEGVL